MNKLFTVLLFFCILNVDAQITYTSTDAPNVGDRFFKRDLDPTKLNLDQIKAEGENLTWDFTLGVVDSLVEYGIQYFHTSEIPQSSFFPNANLVEVALPLADSSLIFYNRSSARLTVLGNYTPSEEPFKYKNGIDLLIFPVNFGSTWENQDTITVQTDIGEVRIDVNTFSQASAWGTIKTPSGTFNCLKLKTVVIFEGYFGTIPISSSTSEFYLFLAAGYRNPIASFMGNEVEGFDGSLTYDTSAYYLTKQQLVAIKDLSLSLDVTVSPNPVQDVLQIEWKESTPEEKIMSILDVQGKLVFEKTLHHVNSIQIPVKEWANGHYLIQIQSKKGLLALERFVKN
ncbi:MAG: T9SS type A sorting domain-containing protein [Bacteroidota bacterium]|nr:T9SS type A sorting domain-containing protein [Bacteroidota bacterium]